MKIVIVGGTGLIGSKLVDKLLQLGHMVVPGSPTTGFNTITGEGINAALDGADVVVDVSNSPSFEDNDVMDFFRQSTMNLLNAATFANVKHYIALSVVGADRLPGSGYLRAKYLQEELIRKSGIAYTILRSTQFFEFASRIAQSGTVANEVHISTGAVQPIASDETVSALVDIVVNEPLYATMEVGGPVIMPMSEFIGIYFSATADPRELVPDEHAPYFGVELNNTSLVTSENARLGKIRYEDWLSAQMANA